MHSKPSPIAERSLILAGLGLQLGILAKEEVVRAFTEWLFDKSLPLGQILIQQKAITQEQRNTLESLVKAHVQQEGDQEKALASFHILKDLESNLDHLADKDLAGTLNAAITFRKSLGLDLLFSKNHSIDSNNPETFNSDDVSSSNSNRFERKQFLESGNLGEIYLAKDIELNRLVVAKYIRPDRADENLTKALFHLEGEVTGSLEHPNIVPVYGLGKDSKGRLYYAMRYIRGRKFTRVIADYHQIPKSKSSKKHESLIGLLQYFQSACLAIEYAHSKSVLHCDIKPDNIMIGDYGEVFVVDWGLVVISGEIKASFDIHMIETLDQLKMPPYRPSQLASSGLHEQQGGSRRGVGGTPAYMAPEQFKATMEDDVSLVTAKSDIYALGSTLYHILTGRAPHLPKSENKESSDAFFFRITKGMIPKPKDIKPEVPNGLQGIVLKAMEVNREDRYGSARELAEDIKRWMADESVSAYQENVIERATRFARNNKELLTAASLVLLFAAVVVFAYGIVTQGYNAKLQISEKLAIDEKENAQRSEQEAKVQRDKAEGSEKTARTRETEANFERKKAETNEKIALQQREQADQQLYVNKIQRANTEILHGDAKITCELLLSIPFNYRFYEFQYLTSLLNGPFVNFSGHQNRVNSVCFSPDGKRLASGCWGGMVKLWDAENGNEIKTMGGHTDLVTSVCFSPDGKNILSCSRDKTLKIWDAMNGKEIININGHDSGVNCVSFSPDGKNILSCSRDKTLKIWDASTYQLIFTMEGHDRNVTCAGFSPDGKKIVSGTEGPGNQSLKIWETRNGKEIKTIEGHKDTINSVSFSPDGKKIASGSWDKTVKIWNADSGDLIQTFDEHQDSVSSVIFSPDGKTIASVSFDKNLIVWDSYAGQKIKSLKGHTEPATSVSFSPDGKRLVSGAWDGMVKIWDGELKDSFLNLKGHVNSIDSVCFSPDGKRLVSGGWDRMVKLWDAENGNEIKTIGEHTDLVTSVCFSPDGKKIVSGSWDKTVKIWDIESEKEVATINGHDSWVNSVSFSPDGKNILSCSRDKTLKIWDAATYQLVFTMTGHDRNVKCACYSPDGKKIVSGTEGPGNQSLKIWETKTGKVIKILKGHKDTINSVSFSPDGRKITSGSWDKTVKIWNADSGDLIQTFDEHQDSVFSVIFSPDGKRILSGSRDKTVKVWDLFCRENILTLKGDYFGVTCLALDAKGEKLARGGYNGNLNVIFSSYPLEKCAFKMDSRKDLSVKSLFLGEFQITENLKKSYLDDDGEYIWKDLQNGKTEIKDKTMFENRMKQDKNKLSEWAKPNPKWHLNHAADSEKKGQWFAVAFHLRKLKKMKYQDQSIDLRLKTANEKIILEK